MRAAQQLDLTRVEDYTLVDAQNQHKVYNDYEDVLDGRATDLDTSIQKALRQHYPELSLTVTVASNGMKRILSTPSQAWD